MIRLSFAQGRVVGAMIEKAMTTPTNYPMSLNAITVACNQVSNRDPVTEFSEADVELILRGLADDGLAKMVHRPGDRVVKYRQALDDALTTSAAETALLAVLLLRGSQTPGELRQRTTRYVEFATLAELENTLAAMGERALVRRLERQPGQKESRYEQLVTHDGDDVVVAAADGAASAPVASHVESHEESHEDRDDDRHEHRHEDRHEDRHEHSHEEGALQRQLDDLKRRFEELLARLGEEIP